MDLCARLLESATDAVCRVRWSDGRVLSASAALGRLLGEPQLVERTLDELLGPGTLEAARAALGGGSEGRVERRRIRTAGGEAEVALDLFRAEDALDVFVRQTEHTNVDAEARRRDRLESLAQLAGGIAHDFNNLLAAIVGNLSAARRKVPAGSDVGEMLALCEDAALSATGLTRQLLALSGKQRAVTRVAALEPLVREWTALALSGSGSRCDLRMPPELWPVAVDEAQLGQALGNLVVNAAQAMRDRGTVVVEASNATLPGGGPIPLPPGAYVRLTVRDEGVGIRPEDLARVFDPFFTTKAPGHGLGLATTHAIVQAHGGHVGVESEPGAGTTFTIHLPAAPGAAPAPKAPPVLAPGAGRVLVMDDDPQVRRAVVRMLQTIGYGAATAADGAEALTQYVSALEAARPFDAVIADLTVQGGMGGRELAARLTELDPRARVIASTGYSTEGISDLEASGFRAALSKPYRVEDLAATLATVLKQP